MVLKLHFHFKIIQKLIFVDNFILNLVRRPHVNVTVNDRLSRNQDRGFAMLNLSRQLDASSKTQRTTMSAVPLL